MECFEPDCAKKAEINCLPCNVKCCKQDWEFHIITPEHLLMLIYYEDRKVRDDYKREIIDMHKKIRGLELKINMLIDLIPGVKN